MRRPAIVLAIIFVILFVIIFLESLLLENSSELNVIKSSVDDEKFSEYDQELDLERLLQPDELKPGESAEKQTEITLG